MTLQPSYTPVTSSDDDDTYCVHSLPLSLSNSGSESDLDTDGDRKSMPISNKKANRDKGRAIDLPASGACSSDKPPTASQSQGETNIDAGEGPSAAPNQIDTSRSDNTNDSGSQPPSEPPASTHRTTATQHESRCVPGAVLLAGSLILWFIITLSNSVDGPGLGFAGVLLTVAVMTPVVLGVVLIGLGIKADGNARYERVLDSELGHADGRPVGRDRRGKVWCLTEGDIVSASVVFGAMLLVVAGSAMLAMALSSESHPSVHPSVHPSLKQNVTTFPTRKPVTYTYF